VNGKKACYYCGKSKVRCETDVGQAAGLKKENGPAKRKSKKSSFVSGEEGREKSLEPGVEPSARQFT
jgi:hypothetical protein